MARYIHTESSYTKCRSSSFSGLFLSSRWTNAYFAADAYGGAKFGHHFENVFGGLVGVFFN